MQDVIEKMIEQVKNETDFFNKAKLLDFLRKTKDVPLKELADKLHIKPQYLCHIIRLNRLPEIVTDAYYSRLISISHLFILSRLKDKKQIMEAYEKILGENLTTDQTESLIREILYGIKSTKKRLTEPEKENIVNKFTQNNKDVSVKIIQTRIKSKIIIEIKGDQEKTTEVLKKILNL